MRILTIAILTASGFLAAACTATTGDRHTNSSSRLHGYPAKPGFVAVAAAAHRHGVDPRLALAVARAESGGRCDVRSRAGAKGVMQVMPATARRYGVSAKQLYSCQHGATAGVLELKRLLALTGGNRRLALIGYNCGEGCITRKRLPKETRHYVNKINSKN